MAKTYSDLDMGFLTMRRLTSKIDGRRLMSLLDAHVPELAPEKFDNHEPVSQKFNSTDHALESWKCPFLWTNSRSHALGRAWMGQHPNYGHDSICLSARSKQLDLECVATLFESLSAQFSVDFAYLHCTSIQEIESKPPYDMLMPFRQGVNTFTLRKCLPNLGWATVFGFPYVELFGKERLLNTPAHRVVELAPDTICVYLTASLQDVATNYRTFESARRAAKLHLNSNAFLDVNHLKGHLYNTPKF